MSDSAVVASEGSAARLPHTLLEVVARISPDDAGLPTVRLHDHGEPNLRTCQTLHARSKPPATHAQQVACVIGENIFCCDTTRQ